ncbi:MAG: hypothetical protein ACOX81_04385 [Candidatus Heteroscillospira sp.]|jgi:hypothetical protein
MLLEVIDLDKLRRALIYSGIMLLALLVQETVLSRISLFGVRAMILPIFPVALGMLQGGWWGMGFGLACGMLSDAMFAETQVLFTILMPFIGFLATAGERFLLSRRPVAFFFACLCALLLCALAQALRVLVLYDGELMAMLRVALLQTLYSTPFVFVFYYPCRALAARALD